VCCVAVWEARRCRVESRTGLTSPNILDSNYIAINYNYHFIAAFSMRTTGVAMFPSQHGQLDSYLVIAPAILVHSASRFGAAMRSAFHVSTGGNAGLDASAARNAERAQPRAVRVAMEVHEPDVPVAEAREGYPQSGVRYCGAWPPLVW
jgi:hypothetical protein